MFQLIAGLVILSLIFLVVIQALFQAVNNESSRYLVRLLWVVIVPMLAVFGLLIVVQVVGWIAA